MANEKGIPLTHGLVALVDAEDFAELAHADKYRFDPENVDVLLASRQRKEGQ